GSIDDDAANRRFDGAQRAQDVQAQSLRQAGMLAEKGGATRKDAKNGDHVSLHLFIHLLHPNLPFDFLRCEEYGTAKSRADKTSGKSFPCALSGRSERGNREQKAASRQGGLYRFGSSARAARPPRQFAQRARSEE